MPTVTQRSFAAGEVAPSLWGRADLEQYGHAARGILNLLVTRHGSLRKRPGTEFCAYLGTEAQVADLRLVPFVASGVSYVVVVVEGLLAVCFEGAQVAWSGDPTWSADATYYPGQAVISAEGHRYRCLQQNTDKNPDVYGLPLWAGPEPYVQFAHSYLAAELASLSWAQCGDVLTLVSQHHPPLELRRRAHGQWECSTPVFPVQTEHQVGNLRVTSGPLPSAADPWHPGRAWTWHVAAVVKNDAGEWVEHAAATGTISPTVTGAYALATDTAPVLLAWEAPAGVIASQVYYRVYRGRNNVYGLVGETESAASRSSRQCRSTTTTPSSTGRTTARRTPARSPTTSSGRSSVARPRLPRVCGGRGLAACATSLPAPLASLPMTRGSRCAWPRCEASRSRRSCRCAGWSC